MKKTAQNLLADYHLLAFDELDSTNEEAKRLARNGGAEGAVIWSKRQTAGKGRAGREWVSLPGNLFVSFLLSPECDMEHAGQLSFVAALAAAEAVQPLIHERPILLKWPNDLLVEGRKLGGILLESFVHEGKRWVVAGIGINIDAFPGGTSYPATSLKAEGVEIISAKIVLSRLIHHFSERYNQWQARGFGPIRHAWRKSAFGLGQEVRVSTGCEELSGVFKGIDEAGALMLQMEKSKSRKIAAGDVVFATPMIEPQSIEKEME